MTKIFIEKDYANNIFYYKEGTYILHREDGPAVEWNDGDRDYWLHGEYYEYVKTDEEWLIFQIIN